MTEMDIPASSSLIDRLLQLQDEDGDKEAFIFYGRSGKQSVTTRRELVRLASRFAFILKESGIGHKDAVVNTLPNSLERVVTDMGIILAGAAPVNSIPALTSGEIFFSTARRSQAKAVIVYPGAPENSDWALIKEGIVGTYNGASQELEEDKALEGDQGQTRAAVGANGLSSAGKFVFRFRCKQTPEVNKVIVVSRRSTCKREDAYRFPPFLDFLLNMKDGEEYIERKVVCTDVGYYHTTTGTTGMQKIVPRLHSALLKVAETVGQMAPCRVPSLFVTVKLGWNSGFPYMFFHFGSTCVMIDDIDFAKDNDETGEELSLHKQNQAGETNGVHNGTPSSKLDSTGNGVKEMVGMNNDKNGIENRTNDESLLPESNEHSIGKHADPSDHSLYEVYWQAIHSENVMFAHLSPSEIDGIARANETLAREGRQPNDLLTFVVTGGLPVRQNIVASALEYVCRNIVVFYGLTEAGVVSYNVVQSAEDYTEGDSGRLYRGVECRITDDDGNVLPVGQTGNIEFKTEAMFQGFLKNVERTREAFTSDGWFVTADLGYFKPDGTLAVRCRKDDVILHGCVLIYPTAIEMVLRRCPGVRDVVVVPVPDKLKHHNICACVVKTPGKLISEEEVKKSMDEMLAYPRNVEIPTPQHVIFMVEFPLVQNVKVDRKLLAKIAAKSVLNASKSF